MKRDYRVVTNGEWYEIEYKYKLWPLWFRHKPNRKLLGQKPPAPQPKN